MTGARMFQDGREVEPDEVDRARPWFVMSDWLAAGAAKARREWEPDVVEADGDLDCCELSGRYRGELDHCGLCGTPFAIDDGGPGAG